MVQPLKPEEAIEKAEKEPETAEFLTFFGFFNTDGNSLGDQVSEAFLKEGLLTDDGLPTVKLTQFFQQPSYKKTFESQIRKLAAPTLLKNLVLERLNSIEEISIIDNYELLIRGFLETAGQKISNLIEKNNLPTDDFLDGNLIESLTVGIKEIVTKLHEPKVDFKSALKKLLNVRYQNEKLSNNIADTIISKIESQLNTISLDEVAKKISFYVSINLIESQLIIDLNFYQLVPNPKVNYIDRYQLETITLDDRLTELAQEMSNLSEFLKTTLEIEQRDSNA